MKKRIISLMLTVSMLISMFSLGIHASAVESGVPGIGTAGASVNDGATMHQIYWTRSVEYSPWLTSEASEVTPEKRYNPAATDYAAATNNYLSAAMTNPYILNMGRGTTRLEGDGYVGSDPISDLEETLNDERMRIAYVDPYFRNLSSKADLAMNTSEYNEYIALYNKIVEKVRATKIDPTTGTGTNKDLLADPVKNALSAEEAAKFTVLQDKRYANLSKSDAAMLELYESDYNKSPADKLIYDETYIWDGGYCPTADDGSTTNTVLGAEPTTKVGLGNHPDIPVYAGWGVYPNIDSTEEKPYVVIGTNEATLQGAVQTKENTFYYVNLTTLEEGVYDSIPTGVYFKYNDKYYKTKKDIQGFGSWQLDGKADEITDEAIIAELTAKGPNEYPAPSPVTGFVLNATSLDLNVKVRGEGAYKDTVISYDSAYIALGGVTPASNADMNNVTVEYSIVNGGEYITMGTPSTVNPYAVKVTANQNIASDATAQVKCVVKYNGTEIGTKYVTVNVTKTIQNQTYNAQYGLYCRGLDGELGNNGSELRLGNTASVGQWATWMSFIDGGRTFSGPIEGLRRFTGYVYLSEQEFRSGNTLYFSALDDILIAGDDSFSIVVNGVPFFRADIAAHNNYENDEGVKFEDNRTEIVKTCQTCGTNCSIYSEDKRDLYRYGGATGAGPWHAHIDTSTAYEATSYLHPGANRIDIIGGDVAQGGGMSRLYLFSSETSPFNGKLTVKVQVYTDPSCSPKSEVTGPLPVGTQVYYKYTVTNTGTDPIYNVVVRDPTIGVRYESDKYEHNEGVGPYGKDPYNTGDEDSPYNNTTNNYTNNTSTITSGEMSQLAELAKLDPGEENAKSIIITTKYNGSNVTDWGASIIGETVGTVINTVYAYADDVPEVQDTANVSFYEDTSAIVDDYAVIDYGLSITVPVLDNDAITGTIANMGVSTRDLTAADGDKDEHVFGNGTNEGYGDTADGTYGTAEIKENKFRYTPNKIVNDIDTFSYYVAKDEKSIANATVTIVPASSVYYEDSLSVSMKDVTGDELKEAYLSGKPVFVGNWQIEGKTLDKEQTYDNNAHYGYDTAYDVALNSDDLYSMGSSHVFGNRIVTTYNGKEYGYADLLNDKTLSFDDKRAIMQELLKQYDKSSGYITFAFEGTGFDVISRCTDDSGVMKATVYKAADFEAAAEIAANGEITNVNVYKSLSVNNVREGDEFAQEQIPTMTIKDLAHDKYVVQVQVNNKVNSYSVGTKIYVDAIRIYDPLGGSDDLEKVNKYYISAEKASVVYKVRDLILNTTEDYGAGSGDYLNDKTKTSTNGNLVYYLPSEFLADNGTYKLEDDNEVTDKSETAKYAKLGPKGEVYLQKYGDGFAFTYDARNAKNSDSITLQIDAKLIEEAKSANGAGLRVTNTSTGASKTVYVKSGTQMFYDFTDLIGIVDDGSIEKANYKGGTFVVQNVSANDIISITKMKISANDDDKKPVITNNIQTPNKISISGEKTEMYPNTTQQLTATVEPIGAIYSEIKWESNDPRVTVDANGKVTAPAVNDGEAYDVTIKATVGNISEEYVITILSTPTAVESITLNADKQTAHVNDVITITADVAPANATDKKLTWSVSNKSMATLSVDENGNVTVVPNAIGTFDVIATAQDGSHVTGTITITVNKIDVANAVITVPETCKVGDVLETTVTVTPENATNKDNYTWVSSDSSVIAVTRDGKLQAIKDGTATVYVNVADGDNTVTSNKITVTVAKPDVTKIDLTATEVTVNVGEIIPMPAFTIEPISASYLTGDVYIATTSGTDSSVVVYDSESGNYIAADGLGENASTELCLAYKNADGTVVTSSPFTVNVNTVQTTFQKVILRINKNKEGEKTHIFFNSNHSEKPDYTYNYKWNETSFDYAIEFTGENIEYSLINNNGWLGGDGMTALVMNISNGGAIEYSTKIHKTGAEAASEYTVEYFAMTIENGVEVPIYIVTQEPSDSTLTFIPIKETSILINNGAASVDVPLNGKTQLTTKFQPINASYRDVTWSTSDGNIARVDENGVVSGISVGEATITVRTKNANKSDTITVIVKDIPIENLTISESNVVLYAGEDHTFKAACEPANNSYEGIEWSINADANSGVSIDQNGHVTTSDTAVPGKYTVTVKTTKNPTELVASAVVDVKKVATSAKIRLQYSADYANAYATFKSAPTEGVTATWMKETNVDTLTVNYGAPIYVGLYKASNANSTWIGSTNNVYVCLTLNKDGSVSYTVTKAGGTELTSTDYTVTYDIDFGGFVVSRTGTADQPASGTVAPGEVNPTAFTGLSPNTADISSGTVSLTALANPGATFEGCTYTWSSDDESVASFADPSVGTLTLNKVGTTTIHVTITGGNVEGTITGSSTFIVTGPTSINLTCGTVNENDNVTVQDKESFKLYAKYDTGADAQNVTWSSSDEGIATVTDGLVVFTKTKFGPVAITAKSGEFTATFTVTAYNKVNKQVLINGSANPDAIKMTVGTSQTLDITFAPAGDYEIVDETFTAVAENATVTEGTGTTKQIIVTPTAAGTAKVTVTSGSYSATLNITVEAAPLTVTKVEITSADTVNINETLNLAADVTMSDGSIANDVTWTIDAGTTEATIANGVLTAGSIAGTVTVTATSTADATKSATKTITVKDPNATSSVPVWDKATNYSKGNVVTDGTDLYVAKNNVTGGYYEITDIGYWVKLTSDPSNVTKTFDSTTKDEAVAVGDVFKYNDKVYAVVTGFTFDSYWNDHYVGLNCVEITNL